MEEIKKDCNWYTETPRPACGILTELVCRNKKCSFFETEVEFEARKKAFEKKNGIKKRCQRCKEFKDIEEFTLNRRTPDGFDNCCRECNSEIMRKYLERKRSASR